jgi:hypothetical protein
MAVLDKRVEGPAVVCSVTAPGARSYGMEGPPWSFVYDGTITNLDGLRAALDPVWVVHDSLGRAGDLIFVHVLKHLARVGPHASADSAMVRATRGLRLARALGTLAFVCSDGSSLYAFGLGGPLALTRLGDAIAVGSRELLPRDAEVDRVASGELVVLRREPLCQWSVLVAP